MKNLLAPFGVVLVLVGVLWMLQGLDVVGGSGMTISPVLPCPCAIAVQVKPSGDVSTR